MNRTTRWLASFTLLCAPLLAGAATIGPAPAIPGYGQEVELKLDGTQWPVYLPATRYRRFGAEIVVEYEYTTDGFGPSRPDFGMKTLSVGELVPGNYTVQARMYDIRNPSAAPQTVSSTFAVSVPDAWGVYTVPKAPQAFEPANVLVRSAAFFDGNTLRASVAGQVIRVDFDYAPDKPVGGAIPPGMTSYASVPIAGLAPGSYRVEGWGRPMTAGGVPTKYFEREITVGTLVPIVEYYNEQLDHYFMAGGPDEVALLDGGGQGGWKRTGERLRAWLRQSDAPATARPVCRFYARGPNSHFYTGNAAECQQLRDLEQAQRLQAQAAGQPFLGWGYEGIAFYALLPTGGACPADTDPVYRSYNDRARDNDANHRFTADPQLRRAMTMGWVDEGVQFCSPR